MSKMIVLMMDDQYPFLEKTHQRLTSEVTVVRQTIKVSKGQKNTVLAKANFLKNLKNRFLVKVDSIYEEEDKLHIMYEYIQNNLKTRLQRASVQQFYFVQEQLKSLSTYLANIGVRVFLSFDRLGFDSKSMVKFFMGLDFQWEREPQEDFLERYYQSQVDELMHPYEPDQSFYNLVDCNGTNKKQYIDDKRRKVSFATLPSRYNRYKNIDQKLSDLKASSKEKNSDPNIRSLSNTDTVPRQIFSKPHKQPAVKKIAKRLDDRKFSGDFRMDLFSRKKILQRQSDIKSQYGYKKSKQSPRKNDQSNRSQIETHHSKSRIEQMKNKQYKEIANSNKHYLQDFLSVLEEDEDGSPTQANKKNNTTPQIGKGGDMMSYCRCLAGSETSIAMNCQASNLKNKAKQAIKNSMKVMLKFKSFLQDG